MKFGQKILEIGPKWHMNKQNIPTMGGFMFIIGIALADHPRRPHYRHAVGSRAGHPRPVGGLRRGRSGGRLRKDQEEGERRPDARQKLVLQILVAAVFILVLFLESDGLPSLMIPFTGISIDLPWPVYIIFAAFVICRRG